MKKLHSEKDIHILGGGASGMALAHYASKNKISFSLIEKNKEVGGNARTIKHGEFMFDTGAHRFHDKDPETTREIKKMMGSELLKVSAPSKIFNSGRMIEFPLAIMDVITKINVKDTIKIILENLSPNFSSSNSIDNFRQLAYSTYGKTLSELFLINYSEKLWGDKAENLSTDISGGRLKNLNLVSSIKEILIRGSNHLDGDFLYPKNGFGQLFDTIYKTVAKNVHLESDVSKIIVEKNKISKIVVNNNQEIKVKKIISTLPLPILINKLEANYPEEISMAIKKIKYRSLKLYALFLKKERLTKNASIYFPEQNIPFTRVYEPKNRSRYMAPTDQTCIIIEVPYQNKIKNHCQYNSIKSFLMNNDFIEENDIIGYQVIDMPYAYPILDINVQQTLKPVFGYLNQIKNLDIVGRAAEFKYLHVHDLFSKARTTLNQI